ncbi:MAG: PAS domain S-box protein [Myxococcales bacterium]|nr:PAS domain S-box protein [Myxococcales bacterium]
MLRALAPETPLARGGSAEEASEAASSGVPGSGSDAAGSFIESEEIPLWVPRADFLERVRSHASPFGAGRRLWSLSEPWISALQQAVQERANLLFEFSDWAALLDRYSWISVESEGPDGVIRWKNGAGHAADPAECAFRTGTIAGLLSTGDDPSVGIEHRSCEARGDPDCAFVVRGVAPEEDWRHASMLREFSIQAAALEGREGIFRRLQGFSSRRGAFPDVRGLRAVRRFMEEVEDPILILARDASVVDANSAATQLSGLSLHEMRGLSARDLLTPSSFELLSQFMPHLFEEGSLRQVQLKLGMPPPLQLEARTRRGIFPVELSMQVSENGETIVCIARDVSERLRLERELEDRNRQLKDQNERISEADRLKSEFLANVSHELTTPLACIKGFARLLSQDRERSGRGAGKAALDAAQKDEFLSTIQHEAERMSHLLRGLLELSKIESGSVVLERARVSLNAIVRESVLVLKPRLDERELDMDCRLDEALPLVSLDPGRIKQVVLNLLDNAIKFSPSKSRVEVRTAASGGSVRLAVRNRSSELDDVDRSRIFDRFVQRDGSYSRQYGGVGLGLNLVRAILDMHGGSIRLEMAEPGVVEFVCEVPA